MKRKRPGKPPTHRSVRQTANTTGPVVQVGGDATGVTIHQHGPFDDPEPLMEDNVANRANVFLSYLGEDTAVARLVKRWLNDATNAHCDVFLAEDPKSVGVGEAWMSTILENLANTGLLVVLASPRSIARPWINVEVGGAWALGKPMVSLCYGGLRRASLPLPYQSRQAYEIDRTDQLEAFIEGFAQHLDAQAAPHLNAQAMVEALGLAIATSAHPPST